MTTGRRDRTRPRPVGGSIPFVRTMHHATADPEFVRRYYRRRVPWLLTITFGGMLLASGTWDWQHRTGWLVWVVAGLVLLTPIGLWMALVVTWERRLVRRLRLAGYRLCLRCGYSLQGREATIACPECGRRCELSAVERTWRHFRPRISGKKLSAISAPGDRCR